MSLLISRPATRSSPCLALFGLGSTLDLLLDPSFRRHQLVHIFIVEGDWGLVGKRPSDHSYDPPTRLFLAQDPKDIVGVAAGLVRVGPLAGDVGRGLLWRQILEAFELEDGVVVGIELEINAMF